MASSSEQQQRDTVTVMVRYGKDDHELQVHPLEDTIGDIRNQVAQKTGVAIANQNLVFNKKEIMELYDDKNLAFYRFNGGCFMTLTKK